MSVRSPSKKAEQTEVEIEIESNIPVPTKMSGYVQNWPLHQLKENQSFHIVIGKDQKEGSLRHALQMLCVRKSEEYERNFVTRKVGEADPKGVGFRIFRLKGPYVAPEKPEVQKAA